MGQTQPHKLFVTDRGNEPEVRPRFQTARPFSYRLTAADVQQWPGFLFRWLALRFFNDEALWDVIADCNEIRGPMDWKSGDTVVIPLDARDAIGAKAAATIQPRQLVPGSRVARGGK